MVIPQGQVVPLRDFYPKEALTLGQEDTFMRIFDAALFVITKKVKSHTALNREMDKLHVSI